MIQTQAKINNNPHNLVWQLRRKENSLDLLEQFLSHVRPTQKFANPQLFDWRFLYSSSGRLQRPADLYQLATALSVLPLKPHSVENGHSHIFDESADSKEDRKVYDSLPIFAKWFSFGKIHDIERKGLLEFFGEKPSKTPAVYMKIRDFVVRLYFANPNTYLTPTACRRSISGDVCAILRVHAFLEKWGLINFQSNPSSHKDLSRDSDGYPAFNVPVERLESNIEAKDTLTKGCWGTLIDQAFQKKRIPHVRCFQCQAFIIKNWFVKKKLK